MSFLLVMIRLKHWDQHVFIIHWFHVGYTEASGVSRTYFRFQREI